MRFAIAAAVLGLTGCQLVFALENDCSDGHDEDGDGVEDACDNCPSIANANQANDLEEASGNVPDDVGDACDLNRTQGGDSIIRFVSFNEPDIELQWDQFEGTWKFDGDTLAPLTFTEGGLQATILDVLPQPEPPFTIELRVIINRTFTSTTTTGNAALVLADASAVDAVTCGIVHFLPSTGGPVGDFAITAHSGDTVSDDLSAALTDPIVEDDAYTIRLEYDPTNGRRLCNVQPEGVGAGVDVEQILSPVVMPGNLGFRGVDASIHFEYFTIYKRTE